MKVRTSSIQYCMNSIFFGHCKLCIHPFIHIKLIESCLCNHEVYYVQQFTLFPEFVAQGYSHDEVPHLTLILQKEVFSDFSCFLIINRDPVFMPFFIMEIASASLSHFLWLLEEGELFLRSCRECKTITRSTKTTLSLSENTEFHRETQKVSSSTSTSK